jgi:hypothetical protein
VSYIETDIPQRNSDTVAIIFVFDLYSLLFIKKARLKWAPGALFQGVKRPGREADDPLSSSAEVKKCVELYVYSPSTPSWRGAQLKNIGTVLPFTHHIYQCGGHAKF